MHKTNIYTKTMAIFWLQKLPKISRNVNITEYAIVAKNAKVLAL